VTIGGRDYECVFYGGSGYHLVFIGGLYFFRSGRDDVGKKEKEAGAYSEEGRFFFITQSLGVHGVTQGAFGWVAQVSVYVCGVV
jgi:hypothetical protein